MRLQHVFFWGFVALCGLTVTSPQNAQAGWFDKKKDAKQVEPAKVATSQRSSTSGAVSAAPASEATSATIPALPNLPAYPKRPEIPQTSFVPAAVSGTSDRVVSEGGPEIARIQKQIKDIIRINEQLKFKYRSQAEEIQKIGEQAKIHQRILSDLDSARAQSAGPQDKLALQEKVRLIQQETEQNQKFIRDLQAAKKQQQESQEKTAARPVAAG